MKNAKVIKSTSIVIALTVVSKIFGFFRDTLIAKAFGTSFETDAYNMAITVPNILFGIFGLAITTTFIPILSESYKSKGKEDMFDFANNVMNILFVISLILCFLGWSFSPYIVKIIAPKFTGETYALTVALTRISIINVIFMAMNSGYTAILQTLEDFTAPALIGIMLNLPIIIYILLGNPSIQGLTLVTVLGASGQVFIQIPWLIKHKYKYRPLLNLKDERIAMMLKLILPIILGASVNEINSLVDKTIGSGLPEGSISALNFAQRINGLVYSIFGSAIVTVMYPTFSKKANEGDFESFKLYINKAITSINLIIIPATFGIIVLNTPIVKLIFERGAFDANSVSMTSTALIFYSLGVVFYGVTDILNRAFYSIQDTRTPMINSIIGMFINIVLNLILINFMGIGGLALSTSISSFVCAVLLIISLRNKLKDFNIKGMLCSFLKIFLSSIIMGAIAKLSYNLLSLKLGEISALLITILLSALVYFIMLLILKVKELFYVLNIVSNKIGNSKNQN